MSTPDPLDDAAGMADREQARDLLKKTGAFFSGLHDLPDGRRLQRLYTALQSRLEALGDPEALALYKEIFMLAGRHTMRYARLGLWLGQEYAKRADVVTAKGTLPVQPPDFLPTVMRMTPEEPLTPEQLVEIEAKYPELFAANPAAAINRELDSMWISAILAAFEGEGNDDENTEN